MTTLQVAGEIEILDATIVTPSGRSLNVMNQILTIHIYESIFNPFISGELIIKDSMELINYFPLVGEETLSLKLRTPGFTTELQYIKGTYSIYKITDRMDVAERAVVYTVHFIAKEALLDLNIKLSKRFNEPTIAQTVSKILTDNFLPTMDKLNASNDKFLIEETSNGLSYISNYWSPVQNINFLAERALTVGTTSDPSFVFFQNRNGLNFVSLRALYNAPTAFVLKGNNYTRNVNSDGTSTRNIEEEYSAIISINVPNVFDYIERLRSGAYSSTIVQYDMTTKVYSNIEYNFLNEYETNPRLNKFPIASKKVIHYPQSVIKTLSKSTGLFDGGRDITGSKYYQRRRSILSMADSCKVNVTALGKTNYTAGQKIYLSLSLNTVITKNQHDYTDHIFSGFYIISSIKHVISRRMHTVELELIKDSLDYDLNTI